MILLISKPTMEQNYDKYSALAFLKETQGERKYDMTSGGKITSPYEIIEIWIKYQFI